ncbi:MAG: tetratricopeptide repeat protein [Pseudomonadota bacterium]
MIRAALAATLALAVALPARAQIEIPVPGDEAPAMPQPPADLPEMPDLPETGDLVEEGLSPIEVPDEAEARAAQLDSLFEQLARAENPDWPVIQGQIWRVWRRSGSPSMDLLLARGLEAMEAEDFDTALLHLDDLVRLAPDFAEGWNQRATLHFLMQNYGLAMRDIETTLILEPRHFGALAGLGIILDRTGYDKGALAAYRRVLELHPNMPGAQRGVEKLSPDVDGREL